MNKEFENPYPIAKRCPFCGKVSNVVVEVSDYKKWVGGEYVQNAFPYLNADQREILLTGICEDCFPS